MWGHVVLLLVGYVVSNNAFLETSDLETTVLYEWNHLSFALFKEEELEDMIEKKELIPENLQLGGIAVDNHDIFITIPRMISSEGVPYTLASVSTKPSFGERFTRPLPWPSRRYEQTVGDCSKLQNALAIEMDHDTETLYVLDTGRTGVLSDNPINKCPAKIVVYDMNRRSVKAEYVLDSTVVNQNQSVLSSFVLDFTTQNHKDNDVRYAYISDAGTDSLIVYDFKNKKTWSFQDKTIGEIEDEEVEINGEKFEVRYGFNSLAISPDFNYVYFTNTGSRNLYQVPTYLLRKPDADISTKVRLVGKKTANSDSLYHGKENLYYSALEEDAVYMWKVHDDMEDQNVFESKVTMKTLVPLVQNFESMQWIEDLTLDDYGYLYFTTNKAHLFYQGKLNFTGEEKNFRIFKTKVSDYSYLHDKHPKDD